MGITFSPFPSFISKSRVFQSSTTMKIAIYTVALCEAKNIMGSAEVKRSLTGDWVNQFYGGRARREIDGEKGFRPMAAMKLYLSGAGSTAQDPQDLASFESMLDDLAAKYTNYGCYCWINGMEDGVLGGGRPRDVTDHHCKELYRCYKCVNVDYSKNYTDVSYTVGFTTDDNGQRALDCSANSKQDGENICECDKRFAENLAATEQTCSAGGADDAEYGSHCTSDTLKTVSGGGSFDPSDAASCKKEFHGHDKSHCCGLYPNRYPYDINQQDCCRARVFQGDKRNDFTDFFSVQPLGNCQGAGGEVVVSESGNPHNYLVVDN